MTPPTGSRVGPDDALYAESVRCVVMPCCGFTYDAIHTVAGGDYVCPLCWPDYPTISETLA